MDEIKEDLSPCMLFIQTLPNCSIIQSKDTAMCSLYPMEGTDYMSF